MINNLSFTRITLGCILMACLFIIGSSPAAGRVSAETDNTNAPNDVLRIAITPEQQTLTTGDTAVFTIVVLNTSNNINLKNVAVVSAEVLDCNRTIGNLAADSNFPPYQCSLQNVTSPLTTQVTVTGQNVVNDKTETATTSARVDLLNLNIQVSPSPSILPEPGGQSTFDLSIINSGNVDLTLTALSSPQFGNLLDSENAGAIDNTCPATSLPRLDRNGGTYTCRFTANIISQPPTYQVAISATARDEENQQISATSSTTLTITDAPAAMSVSLTAPATVYAPVSSVNLKVRIDNNSTIDSLTINTLTDSRLGNVDGLGDCTAPQILSPGQKYECTYSYDLTGQPGTSRTHAIAVAAIDDDNPPNSLTGTDSATINMIAAPTYTVLLPGVMNLIETENDSCPRAYPLLTNVYYNFMPEDPSDWFWFELARQQTVSVELRNYTPGAGNLNIFKGETCSTLSNAIANNGDNKPIKILNLGTLESGRYFIYLFTDGPKSDKNPYELVVKAN